MQTRVFNLYLSQTPSLHFSLVLKPQPSNSKMSYSFAGFGAFGVGLVVFFGSARPAGGDLLVDLRFDADGFGAVLPSFIAETAVFIWETIDLGPAVDACAEDGVRAEKVFGFGG